MNEACWAAGAKPCLPAPAAEGERRTMGIAHAHADSSLACGQDDPDYEPSTGFRDEERTSPGQPGEGGASRGDGP